MSDRHQIRVRRYSIIPWDIGIDLNRATLRRIEQKLTKEGFNRKQAPEESAPHAVLFRRTYFGYILYVRLFYDGLAQFIVQQSPGRYKTPLDFDPDSINLSKWSFHKKILNGDSDLSIYLLKLRKALWETAILFGGKLRFSANEKWENGGISYIFSFFIISGAKGLEEEIKPRLSLILFPKRRPLSESDHKFEDLRSLNDRTTGDTIEKYCFREGKGFNYWYSWASAVCLSGGAARISLNFFNIISNIQKTWFAFYSLNAQLDHISEKVSSSSRYKDVIIFNGQINKMHRLAFKSKNLNRSMISQLDLSAQQTLWEASKLDELYKDLSEKTDLLRSELEAMAEYKRLHRLRYLEAILVILTIVQSISAYTDIKANSSLASSEIILFATALFVSVLVIFRN